MCVLRLHRRAGSYLDRGVGAVEVPVAAHLSFVDVADAGLNPLIEKLHAGAAAVRHRLASRISHLVLGDDEDGVKVVVTAENRLLEEDRSGIVVHAVIGESCQSGGGKYDLVAEPVPYLDTNLFRIEKDIP